MFYISDSRLTRDGWMEVTVISSNFIALMLILNMAMNIHLTVRFLQLKKELPQTKNDVIFGLVKNDNADTLYCINNYMRIFISCL